jgi:hypothetical protein
MSKTVAALSLAGLGVVCLLASGCAFAYAPSGLPAYISVVTVPIAAGPDQDQGPLKKGEATAYNVLGFISLGNASIRAAAADGAITKIWAVDAHTMTILGFYAEYTTIVTGH